MTIKNHYYIQELSKYLTYTKTFQFKDNLVPYDKITEFLSQCGKKVFDAIGLEYEHIVNLAIQFGKMHADNEEITDVDIKKMLFDAAIEFTSRLDLQVFTKDKFYYKACSHLFAYIMKNHAAEFLAYSVEQSKAQKSRILKEEDQE